MKSKEKNIIYKTPRFNVIKSIISKSNELHELYYLEKRNAVLIVATIGKKLVVIENYREPIQERGFELPGGRIEDDDLSTEDAAKRELFEETGLVSNKWVFLGKTYPLPSVTNEAVFIYHADITENHYHEQWDQEGEDGILSIFTIPLNNIKALIKDSRFVSSVDSYAIMLYIINNEGD